MPTFRFTRDEDTKYYRRRCAEMHRLYHNPRRYLVHAPAGEDPISPSAPGPVTPLNIYGEPGEIETGIITTNGSTSAPATREFTSAGSTFITSGVKVSDILEIHDDACDNDNGRYNIVSVDSETKLTVDVDWPQGGNPDIEFSIHILKERYTPFPQLVPFLVRLNPTEKELSKWGIDEKREAKIVISTELCEEIGLQPKIGDRFDYPYEGRVIQYEIKNLFEADQLGDGGEAVTFTGFATRTTNILP